MDADHNLHKYNIEFNDPVTSENKKTWFKVDDITSLPPFSLIRDFGKQNTAFNFV